jgi:DNA topoisomerase-6 subunit B
LTPKKTRRSEQPQPRRGAKPGQPQMDLFPAEPARQPSAGTTSERAPERKRVAKAAVPQRKAQSPKTSTRPPKAKAAPQGRVTAESLAERQREISVSEFFVKNRHLLGFDNPQKALLTAVRECVDNSLDACSEAGILPSLKIEIGQLAEDRFRITVEDNGPGIVRAQIPKVFGKLLYGSKFHTLKQQRGQQGIGVSAAGMYGQLTTGKPVVILSRTGSRAPAHHFEVTVDTKKNQPLVLRDERTEWDVEHGTRVSIELQAVYKKGRRSVDDYVEQTSLANPHAEVIYHPPNQAPIHYERAVEDLPEEPREIKPHPYGVELGRLLRMFQDTAARTLTAALKNDFSRVSEKVATEIARAAHVRATARPRDVAPADVEKIHAALQAAKLMAPPTNCLSPIREDSIRAGLQARFKADFFDAVTRSPSVYRGNPFQVEVGVAYGGELPADSLVEVYRLANRVPLQYQASGCAITKAVMTVDWRSYGMSMSKGALPTGPMVLMVHIASVWVPFTSESKEAIAHYPEIVRELRLALQEVGRRLASHIRQRRKVADEAKKRSYIDKFIPHIGIALREILALSERDEKKVVSTLHTTLERSRERML